MEIAAVEKRDILSKAAHEPDRECVSQSSTYTSHRQPLRTYGTRALSNDPVEPARKRRRVSEMAGDAQDQRIPAEDKRLSSPRPPSSPELPALQRAGKGTILAYFHSVHTTSSSRALDSGGSREIVEQVTTTPPSSPPPIKPRKKKPRRLRTKIAGREVDQDVDPAVDSEDANNDEQPPDKRQEILQSTRETAILTQASPQTLNRRMTDARRSDAGKRGKSTSRNGLGNSRRVQTTLSLSLSEKGFTECRLCNMLYNPLHAKDAKDHARHHAALQKAQLRSDGGKV